MVEMLVECDYIAKKQDELTIRKGDVVKDVIKKSSGWYEGNLNDKRGLFPDHCVSLRDKDASVILRNKKDVGRQCRVIFSYSQDHEDELNLKVGDVIDVLGEEEEGWWRGLLNGREGVFPSNFVQEIAAVKTKKPSSREDLNSFIDAESRSPSLPPKPIKTICEVKYAYQAQNEDELTLKGGDLITLISKDGVDPGWWKGELNGRIGVFPDNFVAILPCDERPREDVTLRVKPPQLADVAKPVSQRSSVESKASDVSSTKNPPVPAKKPTVPVKKSPNSGGGGIFHGLRKKLESIEKKDVVDGGTGSKNKYDVVKGKKREDENQNAFDQIERNSLLKDVRAGRVKPPVRRPPTNTNKEEVTDIFDSSSESETGKQDTQEVLEIKPQVREWEKRKAPWLEEMKMNQAKRSSTSPGPENKKTIYSELEDIKTVPEKESPVDMSKSMPSLGSKRLKSPLESENVMAKPAKLILKPSSMNITSHDSHSNLHVNSNSFNSHLPHTNNLNLNINDHHPDKNSEVKSSEFSHNLTSNNVNETITYKQYVDLVHKVEVLERLVEKQTQIIAQQHLIHQTAIEELRVKLLAEIDKRLVSEGEFERVAHCMNL